MLILFIILSNFTNKLFSPWEKKTFFVFFKIFFVGHKSCFWGHWYPCFGLLVTSDCIAGSNPNACQRSLASHAIYTLIQCTPLLVEKAGVAREVNLRNPLCTGEEAHKLGNPPWLWNPGTQDCPWVFLLKNYEPEIPTSNHHQ